jgi:hypothetical protein
MLVACVVRSQQSLIDVLGGADHEPAAPVETGDGDDRVAGVVHRPGCWANDAGGGCSSLGGLQPQRLSRRRHSHDVASADLNGDGALDLVVTNGQAMSNSVSVLLGHGDGTFAPRTDYPTGQAPQSVAVGDVTGDSIIDLVVGNSVSDSVSVLWGLGNGTFGSRSDFVVGDGPQSLELGDLNGDSILDLVVANGNESTMSRFLGVGNGTFTARIDYPTLFPLISDSRISIETRASMWRWPTFTTRQ